MNYEPIWEHGNKLEKHETIFTIVILFWLDRESQWIIFQFNFDNANWSEIQSRIIMNKIDVD